MPKAQKKHIPPPSLSSSPKALYAIEQRRLESREEDSMLINRALSGDQKAFHKLRLKYYDAIFKLINRMIRNREEVEDLTQEAFIKAFTSLNRFDNRTRFRHGSTRLQQIIPSTISVKKSYKRFPSTKLSSRMRAIIHSNCLIQILNLIKNWSLLNARKCWMRR